MLCSVAVKRKTFCVRYYCSLTYPDLTKLQSKMRRSHVGWIIYQTGGGHQNQKHLLYLLLKTFIRMYIFEGEKNP